MFTYWFLIVLKQFFKFENAFKPCDHFNVENYIKNLMIVCCFLFVVKLALIFFCKIWISKFNLKSLVFFFKCCQRSAVIANCSFKLNCVFDGLHSMLSSFDIESKSSCMVFFSVGSMISKMSLFFEKLSIVQYLCSIIDIVNHHFYEKKTIRIVMIIQGRFKLKL